MPLSEPTPREPLHTRTIECAGYRRADGLWDFDGRLVDVKEYDFTGRLRGAVKRGEPVHDMSIRLTLDDDFVVRGIEAVTDAAPFACCPEVAPNLASVKGMRVDQGWSLSLRKRLRGVKGCTHLSELLGRMGTVCYQTMLPLRRGRDATEAGPPRLLDTCYAWRADGPLIRDRYPDHYREAD